MTLLRAIAAQNDMTAAHHKYMESVSRRDTAILDARQTGVSAVAIADALGLSRQQVHKIIDRNPTPAVAQLRAEVMDEGIAYENLLEDDQGHVDWIVESLARERGITLG